MESLARWTASDGVRDLWLTLSFAVMVLPMVGLSFWYHRRIRRTPGGRRLMAEQKANRPSIGNPGLRASGRMARGIAAGTYGEDTRRLQSKVYMVVALWLAGCAIMFGLLLWGESLEQTP